MPNSEHENKSHKVWLIAASIYAVIALVAYLIVNSAAVSSWINNVVGVIFPVVLGLTIAYLCNPILRFFDRYLFKKIRSHKVRRACSITCTYMIVTVCIIGFFFLLIPELMKSLDDLQGQYSVYIANAAETITNFLTHFPGNLAGNIQEEEITKTLNELFFGTGNFLSTCVNLLRNYGGAFLSGISNFLVALVISVYFLYSKEKRCAQCKKLATAVLTDSQQRFLYRTLRRADHSFGGFIEGKILDSIIIGVLTYIVLLIFHIPFAVLIAFIVGFTNIIPFFGPFIGAIPSAFIIFIEDPKKVIPFIIIILIIQQIDGNIIGPKILGENIGVSSFCVVVSISIMGKLLGVTGMIIGVPIFAVLIELISDSLNKRLKSKHKPTDIEKYTGRGVVADEGSANSKSAAHPDSAWQNESEHLTFVKRLAKYFRTVKSPKADQNSPDPKNGTEENLSVPGSGTKTTDTSDGESGSTGKES